MKSHETERIHSIALSPNISSLEVCWGWDQKSFKFDLQWEEESDFLHAVEKQAGQIFLSNLQRKEIFVIFNDCQNMLQNVDANFMQSLVDHFPLTEFSIGDGQTLLVLFCNHFLNYNWISRLKVSLKVVFNSIAAMSHLSSVSDTDRPSMLSLLHTNWHSHWLISYTFCFPTAIGSCCVCCSKREGTALEVLQLVWNGGSSSTFQEQGKKWHHA